MPTEILAVADTAASSSDITVADGESTTLALKNTAAPVPPGARVRIEIKDDDGAYFDLAPQGGTLTTDRPVVVIAGPGTYRCTRVAGVACGVFSG